ncbi:MAG: hypothetical protein HEP71_01850 [Roseivirga sp.]|nr:hypothetical protein [Roseivirga sp.]
MSKRAKISWRSFFLEILSIFIGITVAFSLDNWNQKRLQKIDEIKMLKELRNGLQSTLDDMESNSEGHASSIHSGIQLVKFINGELLSTDSVANYYTDALVDYTFTPNTGAYETLKSRGVHLISNDSIRLAIVNLYDFTFKAMVRLEEGEGAYKFYQNYSPLLNKRMSGMKPSYYVNKRLKRIDYPTNYSKRQDHEFMLLTENMNHSRVVMLNFYKREEIRVKKLIEDIQKELSLLSD